MQQIFKRLFLTMMIILSVSACSTLKTGQESGENDPLEGLNRATFAFNKGAHTYVMKPVSNTYNTVIPKTPRKVVRNFFRNLREPWVFINDILQGEFDRAGTTFSRFFINTTVGVGGLLNMSKNAGLEYHTEDFGQTLAVWGVGEGPYLILPFLGPSTARDSVGTGVGIFADPTVVAIDRLDEKGLLLGKTTAEGIDGYSRNLDAIDTLYLSQDPYVFMRTLYFQNRKHEIRNGTMDTATEDDFFDDLEEEDYQE